MNFSYQRANIESDKRQMFAVAIKHQVDYFHIHHVGCMNQTPNDVWIQMKLKTARFGREKEANLNIHSRTATYLIQKCWNDLSLFSAHTREPIWGS